MQLIKIIETNNESGAFMSRTGYIWDDRYAWHDTGTHPSGHLPSGRYLQPYQNVESAESKSRFASLVEVSGLIDHLIKLPAQSASEEDIQRVHTQDYVARIRELSAGRGGDAGDGITSFGHGSYEIALLAAGGTIAAIHSVLTGHVDNAYALVRPPGHHAVRKHGMGYCMFNNIAVAIEWARTQHGLQRVAVIDYDVHHGNGIQSIYYDDPDVLIISVHQDNLFPLGSGAMAERGEAAGKGYTINIPLPAGSGNGAYSAVMSSVAAPAVKAFGPDVIMVASGFDAGANDPLGRMSVSSTGYRDMASQLVDMANEVCGGRLVMSHEGGYSPVHVPFCGLAVLEAMSGFRTGVEDPLMQHNDASPANALMPWQQQVIDAAVDLSRQLKLD